MKKQDVMFILGTVLCFSPFFLSQTVYGLYQQLNADHGILMSFVKFALLATAGESIGLRIRSGIYNHTHFGLLPRAIVWGFLGITIKMAFVIFVGGVPILMEYAGWKGAMTSIHQGFSSTKLVTAFCISCALNLMYAPVMMTIHKITDTHIAMYQGKVTSLIRPIMMARILKEIPWDVQWHFVFKKTIPFFWIPAHTITFLLRPDVQVLFAAILGIVLGVILSVASLQSKDSSESVQ